MKKITILILLICYSFSCLSQVFKEKYIKDANDISISWLDKLNNKEFGNAYSVFHNKVKINSDSISSCNAFAQLMNEFGKLISRNLDTTFFQNNIEGLGDGFYVFIEYKSVYKKVNSCDEYLILKQDDKMKWKILRYDFSYLDQELNKKK